VTLAAERPRTPIPATQFTLPPASEAASPPEHRGLQRDRVRLLVARPGQIEHRHFFDLPALLAPGDLIVVNTSATLAAAVPGRRGDGHPVAVHVSTSVGRAEWVVEVRRIDGLGPDRQTCPGQRLRLPGGINLQLTTPYPDSKAVAGASRLWRAMVSPPTPLVEYLSQHGRPISYGYLAQQYPLSDYQTVYARQPAGAQIASAEIASAGRPFTESLLVRLMALGVTITPVVLHAGVSSPELHEPPAPECFEVPEPTARLVQSTRDAGKRVIAVGTTVVRALETAAEPDGCIRPPLSVARVRGLHPFSAQTCLVLLGKMG
jgi:S-adenosylmethionine:tRNA ribosyltransferase-isomerase